MFLSDISPPLPVPCFVPISSSDATSFPQNTVWKIFSTTTPVVSQNSICTTKTVNVYPVLAIQNLATTTYLLDLIYQSSSTFVVQSSNPSPPPPTNGFLWILTKQQHFCNSLQQEYKQLDSELDQFQKTHTYKEKIEWIFLKN